MSWNIFTFLKGLGNVGITKIKPFSKHQTRTEEIKYGNAGRLKIPTLNIGVPLYDTRTGVAQQIVDNHNSAAFLHWGKQCAIADHSNQNNFANLKYARPGQTLLTIDKSNGESKKYMCVKSQVGYIREEADGRNHIYDHNWESAREQNAGGICIYTCIQRSAPNVMDVMLTYWQPVA